MALINCPECQHQVSTEATTCPGCGYPLQPQKLTPPMPDPRITYLVKEEKRREDWRVLGNALAVGFLIVVCVFVLIGLFLSSTASSRNQNCNSVWTPEAVNGTVPDNGVLIETTICP